ncbi:hypothetical protein NP233_g10171 [Leucocoprinus birnbaumii]|uniref:Uncharacterized protein n=1 Tax=Leucocoprinus birnbaumii TaxID=56174 RepID=A0AAD5VJ50_9AGAR|nr:hypothetical protein NP233_g10171 [Leucocoprinus birnbaumii]
MSTKAATRSSSRLRGKNIQTQASPPPLDQQPPNTNTTQKRGAEENQSSRPKKRRRGMRFTHKKALGGEAEDVTASIVLQEDGQQPGAEDVGHGDTQKEPGMGMNGTTYCSSCHNGGGLIDCRSCRGAVCVEKCLVNVAPAIINSDFGEFTCPRCWRWAPQFQNSPYTPFSAYPNLTVAIPTPASTRSKLLMTRSGGFCIVVFRLASLDRLACVSRLIHGHIRPYFSSKDSTSKLDLIEVEFDFSTVHNQRQFYKRIDKLCVELTQFDRFLVIINTHSTPDTGDLWVQGEEAANAGAVSPKTFLEIAIPPKLGNIFAQDVLSTLVLLTCAGPFRKPKPRQELFAHAGSYFGLTLGFVMEDFIPHYANTFLLTFVEDILVQGKTSTFRILLRSNTGLGPSVESIMIQHKGQKQILILTWHHDIDRPLGAFRPLSCPKCHRLQSWQRKGQIYVPPGRGGELSEPLVLSCKGCGEELVFEPPPGSFTFASGSQKDCGTLAEFNGFWIGRYINHAGEPVIDRRFKMPLLT